MDYRPLGNSNLLISPVGLGTAPIASTPEWWVFWGRQDETESIRTIHTALGMGINWIDTAPFYGWGRGEEIVGKALAGRREDVYIFTKCGSLPGGENGRSIEDLRPATIRQEVENSLRRLNTDYIDLLQFHDPDENTPIEESWGEVQNLIQAGKIRYGGLSNHTVDLIQRALAVAPVTSLQNQYNLMARRIEDELLPFAAEHQIGVITWGPLSSGFLLPNFDLDSLEETDFRRKHPYSQPDRYPQIQKLQQAVQSVAEQRGKNPVDVLIAWVLHQSAVTGAILGARTPNEAAQMLGGLGWSLTEEEVALLNPHK